MAAMQAGDLLLVEALTYAPVLSMASRLNVQTGTVAMDSTGVDPDAFEAWCKTARPKAFYLTPTLQAPTTVTITTDRRERIAEIADRYGVLLIEDDVFGPLKNDKPAPIAEIATHCTVYITSLSKTVAPGLRVGFLKAPEALASALHQSVNLSIWMTPPMSLEVARRMIDDGTTSQLTTQQQRIAVGRQALALEALGETFAGPTPDGFHLWVPLPEGWRADVFTAECRRQGAVVSEARGFAMNATDASEAIRICLSHEASEERLQEGLDIVGRLLHQKPINSPLSI